MNKQPIRKRLEVVSKQTGRRLDIVQQDYVLSWTLSSIFKHPILKEFLVFKGGTALKKCYFGDYRFSEDLDFSTTQNIPEKHVIAFAIKESCSNAETCMREYSNIHLFSEEYLEKDPHPHGQSAFIISAQFPWQKEPLTKVMIEISRDELRPKIDLLIKQPIRI